MTRTEFDATLADLISENQSEIKYEIPLIDDFRSESAISTADLFVITGKPQSYKTTLAVDILKKIIEYNPQKNALWIDCDLKFPKHLIKHREIDLQLLKYIACKSSEDILFALQKVEFYIDHDDNNIVAVVIDSLNSSFWIDSASFAKKKIFYQMKNTIERIVSKLGVTVTVILQDLGDFTIWTPAPTCSTQMIKCVATENGKGFITTGEFCDHFILYNNRCFIWGKRTVAAHEMEFNQQQQTPEADNISVL